MLRKKSMLAAAVCAVTIASASASAAFAGEVTGNGKATAGPTHANSICVFSGKNDDPGAPLDGSGPNGPGGPAQSYGQENKLGLQDPHVFNPGDACRGGSNFARQ
jgi:opacity protein-like surface antigen